MGKTFGRKWTSEEYLTVLDLFLMGEYFTTISRVVNRTPKAVENVIWDDIPRNYRKVIDKHIENQERKVGATPSYWTLREERYLIALNNHKMSLERMSMILCRPKEAVQRKLDQLIPKRKGKGFLND